MRPHPLRASDVLVVAPHPDDEAIGAFGLMQHLRRRGARVRVLVVSDGAASHPGSATWPPHRLVAERRRETRRAMALLGLTRDRIRFLGLPDGALEHSAPRLDQALARVLRHGRQPGLIVGPTRDDAHADHRSVAAALQRIAPRGVRRLGYRVWPISGGHEARIGLRLAPATLHAKRRTLRCYRTQTGRITDATAGFTMSWRHVARFARPIERFVVLA